MELTSVGQTSKKSDHCGLNSSNAKGRKWGVGGGLACVGSGRERERERKREKEKERERESWWAVGRMREEVLMQGEISTCTV